MCRARSDPGAGSVDSGIGSTRLDRWAGRRSFAAPSRRGEVERRARRGRGPKPLPDGANDAGRLRGDCGAIRCRRESCGASRRSSPRGRRGGSDGRDEIDRETAAVRLRFADPQTWLFPVAVTFLVPRRLSASCWRSSSLDPVATYTGSSNKGMRRYLILGNGRLAYSGVDIRGRPHSARVAVRRTPHRIRSAPGGVEPRAAVLRQNHRTAADREDDLGEKRSGGVEPAGAVRPTP